MENFWSIQVVNPDDFIKSLSPSNFQYWEKYGSGYRGTDEKVDEKSIDENTVLHLVCADPHIEAILEIGAGDEDLFPRVTLENGSDVEGCYNNLDTRVPYLAFMEKLKAQPEYCVTIYIERLGQDGPNDEDIIFRYATLDCDADEYLASIE